LNICVKQEVIKHPAKREQNDAKLQLLQVKVSADDIPVPGPLRTVQKHGSTVRENVLVTVLVQLVQMSMLLTPINLVQVQNLTRMAVTYQHAPVKVNQVHLNLT
jgi:hypothetical protein